MRHFITKHWIGCLCIVLAALLVMGAVATPQIVRPGGDDIILSGFLACSSSNADRTCPFRLHYVPLTEGRIYCIKMESSDFFSSLTLEDLRGNLLAMNTDFFEELPECIVFRAPATNRYRLIASATEPKAGFYTITIREMPILMRVDSGLWVTDPLHGDAFRKTHELTLIEGRRYIIDLASEDFEAFVQLLDEEDTMVAFNDGGCHPRPARIVYTAPRTGAFRVVATSAAPFATGAYTLTVCEE